MASGKQSPVLQYIHKIAEVGVSPYLSDKQLMERFVRAQDQAAFAALVERHGPNVLGVCRRILRGHHEAEDAFQATFLVLACKAGSLVGQEHVGPWLFGVAVRTALKARTRAWKRRALERPLTYVDVAGSSDEAGERDVRAVLDEELQRLSPKYQEPVLLCYLEGKTTEEAGQILGCPRGTILSRLATARAKLRRRLVRRGLAAGLAGMLPEKAATAAIPAGLVAATTQAANVFVLGKAAGAGAVAVPVAVLTKGVLTSMFMTKLKTATLWLAVLIGTALGAWALHAPAGEAGAARQLTGQASAIPAATSVQADVQSEARALVDKAIAAAGGQAKLANFTAATGKIKGQDMGNRTFTFEASLQGSNQLKLEGQIEEQGMARKGVIVINGDQGWANFNDQVKDAPKEILGSFKDLIRAFRYVHAVTPLLDKSVTLAPLGEVAIDGKPALGLKVAQGNMQDVHLFFDKATCLPVKAEVKFIDDRQKVSDLEFLLSDYKELNGRKHFTKVDIKQDGKTLYEVEFSEFRWLDKLEDAVFERP